MDRDDLPALRVLVIEARRRDASVLRACLTGEVGGIAPAAIAQSLAEGIGCLREGSFDAVLADVDSVHAEGIGAVASIRAQSPDAAIVVVCAEPGAAGERALFAAGAHEVLPAEVLSARALRRALSHAVERLRSVAAFRAHARRAALAIEAADAGVFEWDLLSGAAWHSPRLAEVLGLPADLPQESLSGWFDRIDPEDRSRLRAALDDLHAGRVARLDCEFRVSAGDRPPIWVHATGRLGGGAGTGNRVIGLATDITARKQAEARLLHDTLHDPLTRLANRVLFLDRLQHAWRGYQRDHRERFAILYLDLDRFKDINDRLGHAAGDAMLVEIGHRIASVVRPRDTVARMGGDEFCVLLADFDHENAVLDVAARIRDAFRPGVRWDGELLDAGASIGIAVVHPGVRRPEDLLRAADAAMYRAKPTESKIVVAEAGDPAFAGAVRPAAGVVRRAIQERRYTLHYQPIVSVDDGMIIALEALLRFPPDAGPGLGPRNFAADADAAGMLGPFMAQVLGEACAQVHRWQSDHRDRPALRLHFNLDGALAAGGHLPTQVAAAIAGSGIAPRDLWLEIPEPAIAGADAATRAMLAALDRLEIALVVDNFGAAQVPGEYLAHYGLAALKIDASIVAALQAGGRAASLVDSLVAYGTATGTRIIAAGVETTAQCRDLRARGVEYAQGFLFSPARPAPEIDALLAQGRLHARAGGA